MNFKTLREPLMFDIPVNSFNNFIRSLKNGEKNKKLLQPRKGAFSKLFWKDGKSGE